MTLDVVTVTSIHVKSAKNETPDEDGYNSDLSDSDELVISSTSSVVDEAEPFEDDAKRKQRVDDKTKKDQ